MTRSTSSSTGTRTKDAANEFLSHQRIAVTGVSRNPQSHGANVVYRRLRDRGYDVFAVNPSTDTVEGDPSYPDLHAIPRGVDAVVIATSPAHAVDTVRECIDLGIRQVWMHRSVDAGSVSPEAVQLGRESGLRVIDGGCPCMYGKAADPGHRAMRAVLSLTGAVPRRV